MITPNTPLRSLLVALLAVTAGCNVDERLWWSPDGSRAAVRTPAGLCLADPEGSLSEPVAQDVLMAGWLPDGSGLALLRRIQVSTWSELLQWAPQAEIAEAESVAKGAPELFKGLRALAGDNVDALDEKFPALLKVTRDEIATAAILCLRDQQPAAVQEAVKGLKDSDKVPEELAKLKTEVFELSLLTLSGNKAAGEPLVLERTLTSLEQPRPSPSTPLIAFRRGGEIVAAPLSGKAPPVVVAQEVEGSFDWTWDGKSLVYAARLADHWNSNTLNLIRVERRLLIDEAGALAPGNPVPLATLASVHPPRVCCLPDGRVLVASVETRLPAAPNASQETRFYVIDLSAGPDAAPVAIRSEAQALPMELAHFAPSPDGKQVALVESGSDVVAVLDLATGKLDVLSPKQGQKCRTLPVWRRPGELYFAALPGPEAKRPEWMRWVRGSAPQVWSRSWPAAALEPLLEAPQESGAR